MTPTSGYDIGKDFTVDIRTQTVLLQRMEWQKWCGYFCNWWCLLWAAIDTQLAKYACNLLLKNAVLQGLSFCIHGYFYSYRSCISKWNAYPRPHDWITIASWEHLKSTEHTGIYKIAIYSPFTMIASFTMVSKWLLKTKTKWTKWRH